MCTHCGKTGRTTDTCYRKHGFPPGFNFTHTKTNQVHNVVLSNEVFSEHCNQEQEQRDIRLIAQQYQVLSTLFKQQTGSHTTIPQQAQVNQVGSFTVDPAHNGATLSPAGNISVFNTIKPTRCLWILDLGATDHVCTSLSDFTSYKNIPPVLISLPNGHRVFTKFFGDVIFNKKFFLTDVLYVPEFTFNLVSASKLSTNLKCHLIFSSTNCVIQDNQTKERIGIVKAKDGLYVFQSSAFQNTAANNVIPSFHCTVKDINL